MPIKDTNPEQETLLPKVNSPKTRVRLARVRRILLGRYLWVTRISLVLIILLALFGVGDFLIRQVTNSSTGDYLKLARHFLFPNNDAITVINNRTNLLILGKGGGSHEAPELTDTMIFASISHDDPQSIDLISLPRDIWISDLRGKLNSVYYWGNKQQENGGLVLAKSTVEEIIGQPVHYAVVFDFSGFKNVIDILGGIDVEVEKGFTDEWFPIPGKENDLCDGDPEYKCRYETITFVPGVEHMNGERALKFVRSRHSEDLESGTDIARSQRQRKVIDAVIRKMTTREIVTSPAKLRELFEAAQNYSETDLNQEAIAVLARRVYQAKDDIQSHSIPEDLLVVPPYTAEYDNLYVFIPVVGDWSQVQKWVQDTL
jgi:polyisoprenyl-teichoic acid--peptidoglycan teichoic acid transferase